MGLGQPDDIAEALSRSYENKALRDPANHVVFNQSVHVCLSDLHYASLLPLCLAPIGRLGNLLTRVQLRS